MCKYFKVVGFGDTGITVNGGAGGRTIIAIGSAHEGEGDHTISNIKLLRLGYSDDYLTVTDIAESKGFDNLKLSYQKSSNNTIEVTSSYSAKYWIKVLFISNKPF